MWNKTLIASFVAVLALISGSLAADNTPSSPAGHKTQRAQKDYRPYPQPDSGYVTDHARLLTRQQQEKIEQMLWRTEEKTGVEVVVVTIDSIDDYPNSDNSSIETFATGLFNKYGIGNLPANDGILLVVAYKDRKARIELGKKYGHDRDNETSRIMSRIIIPEFKAGCHDQGIIKGVDELVRVFTGKQPDHSWKPTAPATTPAADTNRPAEETAEPAAATSAPDQPVTFMSLITNPVIFIPILIVFLIMIAVSLFKNGKTGWGWVCVGLIFVLVMILIKIIFTVLSVLGKDKGDSGGWSSGGFGGGFGGGSSGGGGSTGSW